LPYKILNNYQKFPHIKIKIQPKAAIKAKKETSLGVIKTPFKILADSN
jgi:hypothetical protein